MDNLSSFSYKRRCSIFQKDFQKENCDLPVVMQKSVNNKNVKKPFSNHKKNLKMQKTASTSKQSRKDSSLDYLKNNPKHEESEVFEEELLDNDDADASFKVDILKDVFKDAYSEEDVLNAVGNNNSLEQAVSILLDTPIKIDGDADCTRDTVRLRDTVKTEAQVRSKPPVLKPRKGNKRLFSDDNDILELSTLETPSKQRKLSEEPEIKSCSPAPFKKCILIDLEEQELKTLKELFPDCETEELRSVLESSSGCLDEAISTMLAFSSPQKNKVGNSKKKEGHVDVLIVDDDSDDLDGDNDQDIDYNKDTQDVIVKDSHTNDVVSTKVKMIGDKDDCCRSEQSESEEESIQLSAKEKTEVLSFLNHSEVAEILLVPKFSLKKAEMICKLRPFKNWKALIKKQHETNKFSYEALYNCCDFINERNKLGTLLDQCETIAKDICDLFVTEKPDTENKLSGVSMPKTLITKKQHLTKEPSNVAPGFKLKSYQLTGLNWLIALHKQNVNGILADEMGLGKTIQTIVFLAYLIEQGEPGPHLIVVPASTVDNWKREFDNWCPSIKYIHYCGSQNERRDIRDEILYESEHDFEILLTTYNMAISSVSDRTFLRKVQFHYGVFDEGHMLKNMKSQRYQSLLRIRPRRMLLLTGTPIQNNLLELMSLLTFIMPSMFEERHEGIEMIFGNNKQKRKEGSVYEKEKVSQAKKIMEPFVLRRVKQDVLGHLPEKHTHLIECDLPSRQRKIYDDIFASCYKMLNSSEFKDTSGGLAVCMKLRKAANHAVLHRDFYTDEKLSEMARKYCKDPSHRDSDPNLVFEDMQVMSDFELSRLCLEERNLSNYELPNELITECGKFLYLDSVLPDMQEKGDRVLLFNQLTMMMDIVEVYLQTRKYKYLRLDGSTPVDKRQDLIDRFNTDKDIFIFLLSTKAGGLGINLTSANVVIMYDSDYNPHNDKQAEDRCHRMGQTREVNVYRLVCKKTIEQAILKCAADKIRLHEDMSEKQNSSEMEMKGVQTLLQAVFGLL